MVVGGGYSYAGCAVVGEAVGRDETGGWAAARLKRGCVDV